MTAVLSTVPRLWPGSTILCVASGPSACSDDVDRCRLIFPNLRVLAVNDGWRVAPTADAIYACDASWWQAQRAVWSQLPPRRYMLESHESMDCPGVDALRRDGLAGLTGYRDAVRGQHSGHQAINVAVHLGAQLIVLLGYDMQPAVVDGDEQHHFFPNHTSVAHANNAHPVYTARVGDYAKIAWDLCVLGIGCLNATRRTAITSWPWLRLDGPRGQ